MTNTASGGSAAARAPAFVAWTGVLLTWLTAPVGGLGAIYVGVAGVPLLDLGSGYGRDAPDVFLALVVLGVWALFVAHVLGLLRTWWTRALHLAGAGGLALGAAPLSSAFLLNLT